LYAWHDQLEPAKGGEGLSRIPVRRRSARRSAGAETDVGRQDAGGRFFRRCLAHSKGSIPAERRLWRDGIYAHILDVMSLQGSLSIERMCQLAPVSRAGFYRSRQGSYPVEAEMAVRESKS